MMRRVRGAGSLRLRLLAATLAALVLALALAGLWLHGLFRDHVMRQFETTLLQQLNQLTARLDFDASGQPQIDPQGLSDPRWQQPYSGLYWQLDRMSADASARTGVLRSRSLWDTSLALAADPLADGAVHVHQAEGPRGARMLMLERTVRAAEQPGARWRLVVAGDLQETTLATQRFSGVLWASLAGLGLLLMLAALAQVAVGLAPLRSLQKALQAVRSGQTPRLQGQFPAEVQPLIDDFNQVLDRKAEVVTRARTQAGNLAHALKTPLTVMQQAAATAPPGDATALVVQEQVALARRHIDWHLARARAAAAQGQPGQRTPLQPVVAGLVRVMERLHAERGIRLHSGAVPEGWAFAGEEQDLQEMLGNLLDNACRWAESAVAVSVTRSGDTLQLNIDDDGPGISPEARAAALTRGTRLDESQPGSGLGLAIVGELAELYGGHVRLERAEGGGLSARLQLPAAAA